MTSSGTAATDPKERDAMTEALRQVIDRLFDVEMATRQAQIRQLEQRLGDLREDLKNRAAARQEAIKKRLDDMLKGRTEKFERPERFEKGDQK